MTARTAISRRALLMTGAAAALAPLLRRPAVALESDCGRASRMTPIKARPERAVSLRQISAALAAGKPARLEGLTRLDGYIIVKEDRDIVLWGASERGQPELQVADFVVALRSRFLRGMQDGTNYNRAACISLDTDPEYFHRLGEYQTTNPEGRRRYEEACRRSHWMTVRVDGMPRHTRVAKLLVDADYRMKLVSQGLVTLPISLPFPGDFEARVRDWKATLAAGREPDGSGWTCRYWFTPGLFRYARDSRDASTVRIDCAQVVLKNEDQVYKPGEGNVASGRINPYAQAFTCAWTDRMEDVYKAEPIWRDMHNIYRNFALTRVMSDLNAFGQAGFDPEFLLHGYKLPVVELPATMPGSVRVETQTRRRGRTTWTYSRSVCGGVDVCFNKELAVSPELGGETLLAGRSVVASRPAPTAVAWAVTPAALNGALERPSMPAATPEPVPAVPTEPKAPRSLEEIFRPAIPGAERRRAPSLRDLFRT
jgi:hypothetical protein